MAITPAVVRALAGEARRLIDQLQGRPARHRWRDGRAGHAPRMCASRLEKRTCWRRVPAPRQRRRLCAWRAWAQPAAGCRGGEPRPKALAASGRRRHERPHPTDIGASTPRPCRQALLGGGIDGSLPRGHCRQQQIAQCLRAADAGSCPGASAAQRRPLRQGRGPAARRFAPGD